MQYTKTIRTLENGKYIITLETKKNVVIYTLEIKEWRMDTYQKLSRITINTKTHTTSCVEFKSSMLSPARFIGFNSLKNDLILMDIEKSSTARIRLDEKLLNVQKEININWVFENEKLCYDYVKGIKWNYKTKQNETIK